MRPWSLAGGASHGGETARVTFWRRRVPSTEYVADRFSNLGTLGSNGWNALS